MVSLWDVLGLATDNFMSTVQVLPIGEFVIRPIGYVV